MNPADVSVPTSGLTGAFRRMSTRHAPLLAPVALLVGAGIVMLTTGTRVDLTVRMLGVALVAPFLVTVVSAVWKLATE
jgi:hypothetical protein